MGKCSSITHSGEHCRAIAITDSDYCHAHHPGRAEQRKRSAKTAGKRGGRGRPGTNTENSDVKDLLRKLAEDLLAGNVKRADAAVVSQIWNIYLRAISVEARLEEDRSLAQEIMEIHDALKARKENRWGFGSS